MLYLLFTMFFQFSIIYVFFFFFGQDLLREFVASNDDALTLGYVMSDPATQCRSRGVLQMDAEGRVVRFAEKPNEPLPNSLASAPLYIYRKTVLPHLNAYLDERKASGAKVRVGWR